MERPVVFFNLPRELFSVLVTDWLEWEAVARWDSALCNKACRAEWLSILKIDCVTPVIHVGSDSYPSPPMHRWLMLRHLRTREIVFEHLEPCHLAGTISWLENTSSVLTKITIMTHLDEMVLTCIAQQCCRLTKLVFNRCGIDTNEWKHIGSLTCLEELVINGSPARGETKVPTNLSFPKLHKLDIRWDFDTAVLIQQLPALRSVRLQRNYLAESCDCFDGMCPNLVHLDLLQSDSYSYLTNNNGEFVQLMRSLSNGLRCLILPSVMVISATELRSIAQYHAHSLRCISLPARIILGDQHAVGELLSHLPLLHTVVTSFRALAAVIAITNPTIQHLYIDMDRVSLSFLGTALTRHLPALNTLSISCTNVYDVSELVQVLALRPSIRTVNVTKGGSIAIELKEMMPHVKVGVYEGFDMFCTDF